MKNALLILIIFSIFPHATISKEKIIGTNKPENYNKRFLCLMEKSTGFIFDENKQEWKTKNLEVSKYKFIIEVDKRNRGIFYYFGTSSIDKKLQNSKCKRSKVSGFFQCKGLLGEVLFSVKSNLITHTYIYGYSVIDKKLWNSKSPKPLVSIGSCSQINTTEK